MPVFVESELPVRARTRHHWIVLFEPPGKWTGIALLATLIAGVTVFHALFWLFIILVLLGLLLRMQNWNAEQIILTGKRIIRVQGVAQTPTSESSLRVDRISGVRLEQTVPGKLLRYGTIELEAPGDHPGVRKLMKIDAPHTFYRELRGLVFGDPQHIDPDEPPGDYVTEPLPTLPPDPEPFWRRG